MYEITHTVALTELLWTLASFLAGGFALFIWKDATRDWWAVKKSGFDSLLDTSASAIFAMTSLILFNKVVFVCTGIVLMCLPQAAINSPSQLGIFSIAMFHATTAVPILIYILHRRQILLDELKSQTGDRAADWAELKKRRKETK